MRFETKLQMIGGIAAILLIPLGFCTYEWVYEFRPFLHKVTFVNLFRNYELNHYLFVSVIDMAIVVAWIILFGLSVWSYYLGKHYEQDIGFAYNSGGNAVIAEASSRVGTSMSDSVKARALTQFLEKQNICYEIKDPQGNMVAQSSKEVKGQVTVLAIKVGGSNFSVVSSNG